MPTTAQIIAGATFAKSRAVVAPALVPVPRIPTNVLALDLSLGGGIPEGRISQYYGPESSTKTNLALRTARSHQLLNPSKIVGFLDFERSLDIEWAARLGVDMSTFLHVEPEYGETGVDQIYELAMASDIGMLIIDSIPAIIPETTITKESSKAIVAGNSVLVTRLVQKIVGAQGQAASIGRPLTVLVLNQIRFKVGVMFGNPENRPGGKQLDHMCHLILRLSAKNVVDAKVSSSIAVRKDVTAVLKKWKFPIGGVTAEYSMAMLPHDGLMPGDTNDWNVIDKYLRSKELLVHDKGKWYLEGTKYNTLKEVKTMVESDPKLLLGLKIAIAQELRKKMMAGDYS
jgi:recombination protein RecA